MKSLGTGEGTIELGTKTLAAHAANGSKALQKASPMAAEPKPPSRKRATWGNKIIALGFPLT
jgi:hypothetical protein